MARRREVELAIQNCEDGSPVQFACMLLLMTLLCGGAQCVDL